MSVFCIFISLVLGLLLLNTHFLIVQMIPNPGSDLCSPQSSWITESAPLLFVPQHSHL